jgi:hypothetical protein
MEARDACIEMLMQIREGFPLAYEAFHPQPTVEASPQAGIGGLGR